MYQCIKIIYVSCLLLEYKTVFNNKVLIQFGKSTATGWRTITFPISFSTNPVVVMSNNVNTPNPNIITEIAAHTFTTCKFGINESNNVITILWIAMAY